MKHTLLYLFLFLLMFAVACTDSVPTPTKNKNPVGTFTGVFMYIHYKANTTTLDTIKANVQIVMNSDKTYAVSGDTTTIQAGSHGSFSMDSSDQLQFYDVTYPATGTPTKTHLSGIYNYSFDGVYFGLTGSDPLDTVTYKYNMIKN